MNDESNYTIAVYVKGNVDNALSRAKNRKIDVIRTETVGNDTFLIVSKRYEKKVAQWFCEAPHQAPYDDGSCLWYNYRGADGKPIPKEEQAT